MAYEAIQNFIVLHVEGVTATIVIALGAASLAFKKVRSAVVKLASTVRGSKQ